MDEGERVGQALQNRRTRTAYVLTGKVGAETSSSVHRAKPTDQQEEEQKQLLKQKCKWLQLSSAASVITSEKP